MAALPRIVTLMGSGELSPTMVKVHRANLERLGGRSARSLFLTTPFGFQENATELAQRAISYFEESLQARLEVTGATVANGSVDDAEIVAAVGTAQYVFSGPGSPSYALRAWQGTALPQLLSEKLTHGGGVTFASAAALTLGAFTVPVYEIYKVGTDLHWLDGLDVLGQIGLRVAVIPHYNNAEGGTHDTRYCYLGERRLAEMEKLLPDDVFVLGVDEHTSISIDIDSGTAVVDGLGVVTVRRNGRSVTFETGSELTLDDLRSTMTASGAASAMPATGVATGPVPAPSASPLFDLIRARESDFNEAIERRDASTATSSALELESDLHEWSTDIPGQDELVRARGAVRAMMSRLGELADSGVRDPRSVIGPYVELLIEERNRARSERRFGDADSLRDELNQLGIVLRDSADGTEWIIEEARR